MNSGFKEHLVEFTGFHIIIGLNIIGAVMDST